MRIAYVILTCEAYQLTRRVWQRETSLHSVPSTDLYYLGGGDEKENGSDRVFSWGAPDDYDSLPLKFVDFFVRSAEDAYDWFFLMDDDTYVYVDRLEQRVQDLVAEGVHPQKVIYAEGCLLTHLVGTPWGAYLSGGAGTLLSAEGYRGIQKELREKVAKREETVPHRCADICLGLWLKRLSGHRMEHYDGYHPEMARVGEGKGQEITFHHLREKEDFWAHWLMARALDR